MTFHKVFLAATGILFASSGQAQTVDGSNVIVTVPNGVPRSVTTRAQDTINAADYGVVCDGATDNGGPSGGFSNVSAAANAANKNSGNVRVDFPKGTCVSQSTGLYIAGNGIHLVGYGTTIQLNSTSNSAVTFAPANAATTIGYNNGIDGLHIVNYEADAVTAGSIGIHMIQQQAFWSRGVQVSGFQNNLYIEGGGDVHFDSLSTFTGANWQSLHAGSSDVSIVAAIYGGVTLPNPSEIFFSELNAKGTPDVDNAVDIQDSDGIWFTGGHIGFTNRDLRLAPIFANTHVQGVFLDGVYLDGNTTGNTGLYIPALSSTGSATGRFVYHIQLKGAGVVSNHVACGIDIEEPNANDIDIQGQEFGRDGTSVCASAGLQLSFQNNTLENSGPVNISDSSTTTVTGNKFYNMFVNGGSCLTVTGNPLLMQGNVADASCAPLPPDVVNKQGVAMPKLAAIPTQGPGAGLYAEYVVPSNLTSPAGPSGACSKIAMAGTSAAYTIIAANVGGGC